MMSATVLAVTENMAYEEWLELRKLGIGGSDASVVCGVSRYKSPVELWMEKTDQLHTQEAGEAAYWGTQLEAMVRAEFTKRTRIEVEHKGGASPERGTPLYAGKSGRHLRTPGLRHLYLRGQDGLRL